MRALIIFLILVLCAPAFAQKKARYPYLDVTTEFQVLGINRTQFFEGLTVGNKVPWDLLDPAVQDSIQAAGGGTVNNVNAPGETNITEISEKLYIKPASLLPADFATGGVSSGQILKYNGSSWVYANDSVGDIWNTTWGNIPIAIRDSIPNEITQGFNINLGTYEIALDRGSSTGNTSYGNLLYIDKDGGSDTLWHVFSNQDATMRYHQSIDQGVSWGSLNTFYTDPSPGADREIIAGTMIRTSTNAFALIYVIKSTSTNADYKIRYTTSTDRILWSATQEIDALVDTTHQAIINVSSAVVLSNGDIVVAWSEMEANDSNDFYPNYLRCAVSVNDGVSFGSPNTFYSSDSLATYINGAYAEPAIAADSNDSLVVICRNHLSYATSVFTSPDPSGSWTQRGLIGQSLSGATGNHQPNPELISLTNDRFMAIIGYRAGQDGGKRGWTHILTTTYNDLVSADDPYFSWTTYTPPYYTDGDPGSKFGIINTNNDLVLVTNNASNERYIINNEMLAKNYSYVYGQSSYNNMADAFTVWPWDAYVINDLLIADSSYQVIGKYSLPILQTSTVEYKTLPVGAIPVCRINYRGSSTGSDSTFIKLTDRTGQTLYNMELKFVNAANATTSWLPFVPQSLTATEAYAYAYLPIIVKAKTKHTAGLNIWYVQLNFGYVFK